MDKIAGKDKKLRLGLLDLNFKDKQEGGGLDSQEKSRMVRVKQKDANFRKF